MWITNLTGGEIICSVDTENFILQHEKALHINDFDTIKFCHKSTSYSTDGTGNSRLLKILSAIDDPFKLRKEYYIVIDFEITKSQLNNPHHMVVSSKIEYLDYKIKTYYEYFQVQCDGKIILPNQVYLSGIEKLKNEFVKNVKKLKWWNVVLDGLIEPILFEAAGLFLVYKLFSFSIGAYAWCIILPFLLLDFIILIIMCCKPTAKKWIRQFEDYLNEYAIREKCYNNFVSK